MFSKFHQIFILCLLLLFKVSISLNPIEFIGTSKQSLSNKDHLNFLSDSAILEVFKSEYFQFCSQPLPRYNLLKERNYYVVLNLHNNKEVMPHLSTNIIKFVDFIGKNNVFLSIYESGSTDSTKNQLLDLSNLLIQLDLQYKIVTSPLRLNSQMNRIEYLVHIRNLAMAPLYEHINIGSNNFDSVIFINDIYFCVNDLLELEHQKVLNNADIVGGIDYMENWQHYMTVYDNWVATDVNGAHMIQHKNDEIYSDEISKSRGKLQLPLQVSCIWSGMVTLNIKPFIKGVKFRRGKNRNIETKNREMGECAGSECTTLCLDFIKLGYSRVMVVPRVKVAYGWSEYKKIKLKGDFVNVIAPNLPFSEFEDEQIQWKEIGENFECQPYWDGHRERERSYRGDYLEAFPKKILK